MESYLGQGDGESLGCANLGYLTAFVEGVLDDVSIVVVKLKHMCKTLRLL